MVAILVVPSASFLLPIGQSHQGRPSSCLSESKSSTNCSIEPTEDRRSFLSHVVTATATGTMSALSSGLESASAETSTLAGQIELPPMGVGAWAWGDSLFWGYDKKNDDDLKEVFDYAVRNSKSRTALFDTAELYGTVDSRVDLCSTCLLLTDLFGCVLSMT